MSRQPAQVGELLDLSSAPIIQKLKPCFRPITTFYFQPRSDLQRDGRRQRLVASTSAGSRNERHHIAVWSVCARVNTIPCQHLSELLSTMTEATRCFLLTGKGETSLRAACSRFQTKHLLQFRQGKRAHQEAPGDYRQRLPKLLPRGGRGHAAGRRDQAQHA
jgi:hypothetical protein